MDNPYHYYVVGEAQRLLACYDDETTFSLSHARTRAFLPSRIDGAQRLVTLVSDALERREPLSLIRIGDGEGNLLGLRDALDEASPDFNMFACKFHSQNGTAVTLAEGKRLSEQVANAVASADILGFRSFDMQVGNAAVSELTWIGAGLERWRPGLLGILRARHFLECSLRSGALESKVITSAWVHLSLIPYLNELLQRARSVIVITGRAGLRDKFEARLGSRLRDFIEVPLQGIPPQSAAASHYHGHFEAVCNRLSGDLQDVLVLVGAGFLGKIYCGLARNCGAVALDIGSAFDILANVATRPVHSTMNLEKLRW